MIILTCPTNFWEILEEYPSLSDHELIVLPSEDVSFNLISSKDVQIIGWDIQTLINDKKNLEAAKLDWTNRIKKHSNLDVSYT